MGCRRTGNPGCRRVPIASPAENQETGERNRDALGHDQPCAAEYACARERHLVAVDDRVAQVEFRAAQDAHDAQLAAQPPAPMLAVAAEDDDEPPPRLGGRNEPGVRRPQGVLELGGGAGVLRPAGSSLGKLAERQVTPPSIEITKSGLPLGVRRWRVRRGGALNGMHVRSHSRHPRAAERACAPRHRSERRGERQRCRPAHSRPTACTTACRPAGQQQVGLRAVGRSSGITCGPALHAVGLPVGHTSLPRLHRAPITR
jgi:hypothetical protein